MENLSFESLMTRLRAGDDEAAAVVFHRYARRLVALACRQFDAWITTKADPEDIIQSVFKSFFVRCELGQFEVDDWENLWCLLAVITLRKCGERRDYLRAERRDAAREVALRVSIESREPWWQAIDREPTPYEAAMLADLVKGLLLDLDREARQIAELSLQGYTAEEVADRFGRSERTVWRLRQKLRNRLSRLIEEAAGAWRCHGSAKNSKGSLIRSADEGRVTRMAWNGENQRRLRGMSRGHRADCPAFRRKAGLAGCARVIEDHLPVDPQLRLSALTELVHAELEFRLKRGEPARVEDYLRRFPDLASHARSRWV